jgi:hypothetical protein
VCRPATALSHTGTKRDERGKGWRMDWVAALVLAVTFVVTWVARDL